MSPGPVIRPGVTFVFGQTYTGKTTLMRRELEARPHKRALIFDPSCAEALDGIPELASRAACKSFMMGERSRGSWLRVVRFTDSEDWSWLAGTARHWRGVSWVLDDGRALMELDPVATMASLVALQGRHFGGRTGVELWFVGHRPSDAPPIIRAQVSAVYSFRQREPRDLEILTQWAGSDFAKQVQGLADHRCIKWSGSGVEVVPVARAGKLARNSKRRAS